MKVHFATWAQPWDILLLKAGVKNVLYSYYEIHETTRFDVKVAQDFKRVIIDSGLFTFMFGGESHREFTMEFCEEWMRHYVDFIHRHKDGFADVSWVEMDVQKILNPEAAWELRHKIREMSDPDVKFISPWHLEDGHPDKLIDFADHIAVSHPAMKKAGVSEEQRRKIASYIASQAKRKGKRCHHLGLTSQSYLRMFRFSDTCDSTTWAGGFRFGKWEMSRYGVDKLNAQQILEANRTDFHLDTEGLKGGNYEHTVYWAAKFALEHYRKHAGDQN